MTKNTSATATTAPNDITIISKKDGPIIITIPANEQNKAKFDSWLAHQIDTATPVTDCRKSKKVKTYAKK